MRREKSAYRQKPRKEPTLLRTCKPNTPSAYILPMMNESIQAEEEYKRKNCARAKSMGGGLVGEFLVCFHEEKQIITWEIWRWGCLVNLLLNRQGKYNRYESGEQSVYINILQSYVHTNTILYTESSLRSAMWSVRDLMCFMLSSNPAEKSVCHLFYCFQRHLRVCHLRIIDFILIKLVAARSGLESRS